MARTISVDTVWTWDAAWGWRVGCNFIPSTAGNQLEMWGKDSFDAETIKRELGWAAGLGMGLVRVFLHDLAWRADPDGLLGRLDRFLGWAANEGIGVMPVLFDDCWHEPGSLGPKPSPVPGIHNSIWMRSPGLRVAKDPAARATYVKAIIGAFARSARLMHGICITNSAIFPAHLLSHSRASNSPPPLDGRCASTLRPRPPCHSSATPFSGPRGAPSCTYHQPGYGSNIGH